MNSWEEYEKNAIESGRSEEEEEYLFGQEDIAPVILDESTEFDSMDMPADVLEIAEQFQPKPKLDVTLIQKSKALIFKNLMVLRRHKLFMFFNAILPVLNFTIFYTCIGI